MRSWLGFIGLLHLHLEKLSGNSSLFVESTPIRNLIRFSYDEVWAFYPHFPFDTMLSVAMQYRNLEIVCVYSPCNADIINILARFCPHLRRVEIRILNVSVSEVVALRSLLNLKDLIINAWSFSDGAVDALSKFKSLSFFGICLDLLRLGDT
jgi:hypothetical protein